MTRREGIRGTLYAAVLVWVNGYICRTWFFHPTAQMNSLDGYWAALVRLGGGWLTPSWWRYWDLGIPFEFTSAPMVPAMTAGIAAWGHVPAPMALQAVKAIFYCAAPLALFLLAWGLTRAAGYSFAAGLFYSLVSPGKILAPDAGFRWGEFFSPNRFVMQAVWDETPRVASVTFLMVFLLVLVRWLEDSPGSAGWSGPGRFIKLATTCLRAWLVGRRGGSYERRGGSEGQRGELLGRQGESDGGECAWAGAGVLLALGMLASPFALPAAGIAVFCLLTALRPTEWRGAAIGVGGVFLLGYALTAGFLPPSMWRAMALASAAHEPWDWSWGLLKLLAASAVVWVTAVHYLSRWIGDWRLRFFWLLALAMGWGPVLSVWLQRQVLPQPQHFRMEMEAAIALAVVFGVRAPIERLPRWGKTALVCGLLIFAGQQTLERRRLVKDLLNPADVTKTIEYRTAIRVAREFPGARVMLPGSIAQWANAFTDTVQFAGGEGVAAYSQGQQRAMTAIYQGGTTPAEDARVALAWMRAYGVSAVVVPGAQSTETWKPFAHPEKFDGVLPVVWSEDGVTAYRVPQRTLSLAHVIPENALVRQMPEHAADTGALERYNAALDDMAAPDAAMEWRGRNDIRIRASGAAGRVLSVQVSYHPGWHARVNGREAEIHADGLGTMWLRADNAGPALVELHYDGGWELRLCRWAGLAALLIAALGLARGGMGWMRA